MASQLITNPADMFAVLQALVNFSVANAGFTDEGNATSVLIDFDRSGETPIGGTTGNVYRISKGGMYWHFGFSDLRQLGSTQGNCQLYGALMSKTLQSAMNSVSNLGTDTQERYSTSALITLGGPYENVYFYSQGNSVSMVLEVLPNSFVHLSFGVIDKFGSFTGGEYLTCSNSLGFSASLGWDNDADDYNPVFPDSQIDKANVNCFMYIPNTNPSSTTESDNFMPFVQGNLNTAAGKSRVFGCVPFDGGEIDDVADDPDTRTMFTSTKVDMLYGFPLMAGRQVAMTRTVSLPILLRARNIDNDEGLIDDSGSIDFKNTSYPIEFLGTVNGIRVVNMYNANPKDIIDTNWRVFPLSQKTGSTFAGTITGELGIAYLED